jgi:hypothetical protein
MKALPAFLALTALMSPVLAQEVLRGPPPVPATLGQKPLPLAEPAATSAPANFRGTAGDLAGRYNILREGSKDTGCLLTLDDKARGPSGSFKAQLAPACRDQGIVIFDPVGWRLERGTLFLVARKGHAARFDLQHDGVWWKDPKEGGKPLGVKNF